MDLLQIEGLTTECCIGVHAWEKAIKQRIVVNLSLRLDNAKAAASDELIDTLNYKKISEAILAFLHDSQYNLIESLAEGISSELLQMPGIDWCRVEVVKPYAIKKAKRVSICIERMTAPD